MVGTVPRWSADGRAIVVPFNGEIFGIDTTGVRKPWLVVPEADYWQFHPSINADARVVYEGYRVSGKLFEEPLERFIETAPMDGGGKVKRLYDLPKQEHDPARPAWSPDGSQIAFKVKAERSWELDKVVVINAEGQVLSEHTPVPEYGPIRRVVWSNDGQRIAIWHHYRIGQHEHSAISTVNSDGTGEKLLFEAKATTSAPAWSSDGVRLYFAMWKAVSEIDPASGVEAELTDSVQILSLPSIGGKPEVILDLDVSNPGRIWDVQLSPNEEQVLYAVAPGNRFANLNVANADGTFRTELDSHFVGTAWAPDGQQIAVLDLDAGTVDLFTVLPDGIDLWTRTRHWINRNTQP